MLKNKVKNFIKAIGCLLNEKTVVPIPNPINAPELLKGKVALITGGSGGIGFAMAESFLKSGAKVIITGTSEEKLRSCCEKINRGGKPLIHSP